MSSDFQGRIRKTFTLILKARELGGLFKSKNFRDLLIDDSGSISLLIIGLFIAALSTVMVITDVAVVANAKRSLDQVTEAAAIRAVHNLDEKAYYSGKHTILTSAVELLNGGQYSDNRIPVDCEKGRSEVTDEFAKWIYTNSNMKTLQIKSYEIARYQCVYDVVHLETSAMVKLPFPAPFTNLDQTTVRSTITTLNEKDKGLYLFGVRIH